ncbi:aminotransferase class I/II-fold pyridoxal phosphate-dependent enzyme [Pseudodesulfovibrio methanolicus]|uniref:Pyridoxal phosphate-dependent aminotransferase family protein n=1 Tax=Pseudodesulfovibrio methanolicus TaxID=3126690 RepID=A0ABZ2ITP8_9BACT
MQSYFHNRGFNSLVEKCRRDGIYVFFQEIDSSIGYEVMTGGKRVIMVGSNDYLGLTQHPRVGEASQKAIERWGSGPGGSRFLCGNLSIITELEETVAALLGKKGAVVHTTGFLANAGTFTCLADPCDLLLCDRDSHASIFEGAFNSRAKMRTFAHNDMDDARKILKRSMERHPEAVRVAVTEGVFSMSGSIADLPGLIALKREDPSLIVYLDDAHGLGVMGDGRGTAHHFSVTQDVDVIMGTFSKALASIGGFIASDDLGFLEYLKHKSRTLMFSAALPAASAAAALESCKIIREEPERVWKLWENTRKARQGFRDIGLKMVEGDGPVIGVLIGDDAKAFKFSLELLSLGVFALPAVYPAVPKGQSIIRVAFMSTHEDKHIEQVLDCFKKVASSLSVSIAN